MQLIVGDQESALARRLRSEDGGELIRTGLEEDRERGGPRLARSDNASSTTDPDLRHESVEAASGEDAEIVSRPEPVHDLGHRQPHPIRFHCSSHFRQCRAFYGRSFYERIGVIMVEQSGEVLATADIVVVGAGIVGLCTAWELSKRGYEVAVLEQRFIGFGATSRNPGAVWLQTRRAGAELELARAGVAKYQEYVGELGDVFAFQTTGGLVFDEAAEDGGALERYLRERDAAGLDVQLLEGTALQQLASNVPATARRGVLCRDDAQIDAHQFVSALSAACVRRGVRIFEHTAVLTTLRSGDQVTGVQSLRGRVDAGAVVWATGAWATSLTLEGLFLPMRTVRLGQIMTQSLDSRANPLLHGLRGAFGAGALLPLIDERHARMPLPRTMLDYDDTIVQNRGGSLYVGHSVDGADSLNPHITVDASREMFDSLTSRFPEHGGIGITGLWAGLNAVTADDMPIIDQYAGAFINAGHAWGVASAPIAGQIMADVITGEANALASAVSLQRSTLAPVSL